MLKEKLRKRMEQQGLTIAELAKEIGVARQTVYRYLTGDNEPTASMLKKIAEVLCCTADWFFSEPFVDMKNPKIQAMFESSSDLTDAERTEVIRFIDFVKQKRAKERKLSDK